MGGGDEYKNLVIIHKFIHILIHATDSRTIKLYYELFRFTKNQMKKINRLREKLGLSTIAASL